MLIEYKHISDEALLGIAQQYVETHISEVDTDLKVEQWTKQVIEMVKKGELLIEFSEANESVYLKQPDEIIGE
ncbi:YheU family protein [Aliikangiella sp. IMCC44359]|uniref:YheU family protein n=1 Tax=Aliikangiella sp. IMCC44359 TaxID=3459125 RepID=UPI00403ADB9B